jgi:hypothetical protein
MTISKPLAACLAVMPATPAVAAAGPPGIGDFRSWLRSGDHRAQAIHFQRYLARFGVEDVLPPQELLRTARDWRGCGMPFEVPPPAYWTRIISTLRFIRDEIRPRIGRVEAVSSYRNPHLNRCAAGAPKSAHVGFWGVDLVPATSISQQQLVARLCALHREKGRVAKFGLGFYGGLRFHVDTKGYRLWGSDNRTGTSPCL